MSPKGIQDPKVALPLPSAHLTPVPPSLLSSWWFP